MKITFQYVNCQPAAQAESYIKRKMNRLGKLFDGITMCQVVLKSTKNDKQNNFTIEAKMEVPGNDLYASDSAESFELAADEVSKDLESQIKKHKDKLFQKPAKPADYYVVEEGYDEELE